VEIPSRHPSVRRQWYFRLDGQKMPAYLVTQEMYEAIMVGDQVELEFVKPFRSVEQLTKLS
jgi:hypothetical protein